MLALKHLRDWSYDDLEREVTGSLVYRRFCRIDGGKVPDAKTMVRLGQVIDGPTLQQLLRRLVTIATATGVTKGKKMRVDTTVVEAPIHHPTDSGALRGRNPRAQSRDEAARTSWSGSRLHAA